MTLLQTLVIAGTVVWGVVAIGTSQTHEEEKQRTEQHAKENSRND